MTAIFFSWPHALSPGTNRRDAGLKQPFEFHNGGKITILHRADPKCMRDDIQMKRLTRLTVVLTPELHAHRNTKQNKKHSGMFSVGFECGLGHKNPLNHMNPGQFGSDSRTKSSSVEEELNCMHSGANSAGGENRLPRDSHATLGTGARKRAACSISPPQTKCQLDG